MLTLDHSDLLGPSGLLLLHEAGLTREQAFDVIAARAASPSFQAEIARFESMQAGRELLAMARRYWASEGLPCPWECWLDLTPVS